MLNDTRDQFIRHGIAITEQIDYCNFPIEPKAFL